MEKALFQEDFNRPPLSEGTLGIPIFWRTVEEVINSRRKEGIYERDKKNVHQGI